jgi:hypothetical protein
MKNKIILIVSLGIFISTYYLGQLLQDRNSDSTELLKMDYDFCDPSLATCVANYLKHQIKFSFKQAPSALKPFLIQLDTTDIHVTDVLVDFKMENMDMGINIIRLKKTARNRWAGEAILPVCSLGRNDWTSRLQIKSSETQWYATFLFKQE